MIKIDVLIKEKKWKKYINNPQNYLKNKINKIKSLIPIIKNKKVVFSVLLTGNNQIKNLNKKFRNKNKTTDVLSFPFYHEHELRKKIKKNNDIYLGDVILNYYKIKKVKKEDFIYEFNKLWVHGLLHLIGHKHYKNKDFKKMNKLEIKITNKIQNIK